MSIPTDAFNETRPRVIRVGLIAFGVSGRVFHAPFLIAHPLFSIVAVFERTKYEAEAYCSRHGVNIDTVRSAEDLCKRLDIDLVVVCR
jgi:scyllo-inositol 2-dehydrogenase (NADP+)